MRIQINDGNYPYYKKIFEIIQLHLNKLYPPEIVRKANPIDVLNGWELKSKTMAKRGLKAGLQDLIVHARDFPADLRSSINKDLAANELADLSELQGTNLKIIARVMKRKQVKTMEEFNIVKEEVIDMESILTDVERAMLDKAIAEFELSKGKTTGI